MVGQLSPPIFQLVGKSKLITHKEEIALSSLIKKYKKKSWQALIKADFYEEINIFILLNEKEDKLKADFLLEKDELGELLNKFYNKYKDLKTKNIEKFKYNYLLYKKYRNKFVNANLKLVAKEAIKRANSKYPADEIFQFGIAGLIKGVEKFDKNEGTKFSTFGTWWILHEINRSFDDYMRQVRIPVNVCEDISKLKKIEKKLKEKNKEISDENIIKEWNQKKRSIKNIEAIRKRLKKAKIALPMINHGASSEELLAVKLNIPNSKSLEDEILQNEELKKFQILFNKLPKDQKNILYEKDLCDNPLTLDQIKIKYNIDSREKVYFIKRKALNAMQNEAKDRGWVTKEDLKKKSKTRRRAKKTRKIKNI